MVVEQLLNFSGRMTQIPKLTNNNQRFDIDDLLIRPYELQSYSEVRQSAVVWFSLIFCLLLAANSHLIELEQIKYNYLRIAFRCMGFTQNPDLEVLAGVLPL